MSVMLKFKYILAGSSQQETSISEEPVGATGYTPQQQAVTGEPSISSEG